MRLLCAFLGIGNYQPGRYVWEAEPSRDLLADPDVMAAETCFVQAALFRLLDPDRCIIFVTDQAGEKNWDHLVAAFREAGLPSPERVRIEEGMNTDQLRANFNQIILTLNDENLFPRRKRAKRDDHVFIDITHGFRSLPFFAGAAISFLKAVRSDWPATHVFYGAWDARRDGGDGGPPEVPIWDLTYFVDMVDWAQALRLFLKTGRAEDAARIGEQVGNRLGAEWAEAGRQGEPPRLKAFGSALREFSSNLATVRTGKLVLADGGNPSLVDRLLGQARAVQAEGQDQLPGLGVLLDEIIQMIKPLGGSPTHLAGTEHAHIVAALAGLYLRFERPLQAATTLREGYINFVSPANAAHPGAASFDNDARKRAEELARTLYPKLRNEVGHLRNDLMHAGYRPNASAAPGLTEKLRRALGDFCSDSAERGSFLNISNHPHTHWDDEQRRAALVLGQPIHDISFPDVAPEADEDWIRKKADELFAAATGLKPAAAMVQGEFTLSFALVQRLEAAGIACYAASSPRLVEEGDGEANVTSTRVTRRTFRFTRLRRYVR